MKITFTLNGFVFKRAEYTKTFQDAIRLELRNGAREFVKEAILRVPVRTGFARGALLNLGDAIGLSASANPSGFLQKLNRKRLKVSNVPVNGANEYYTDSGGRVLKTPENARQFSTNLKNVFEDDGRIFKFNYAVTILYYEINDVTSNKYTPSAPWNSFVLGRAAFINYLERVGLKRLPAITSYIVKAQIR